MVTPNEKLRLFAPTLSDTGVPPAGDIDSATTAETNTALRLAPDGAGGVEWGTGGGGTTYGTPALTLGTSNAAGSTDESIRRDATILAFDATTPAAVGTAAVGAATVAARRDHVHATGAGTPSTQAFGDAAATGTGPAAAMTDHKHAMPANPYHITITLGPFYINDLAGTATTQATLGYFNTATALSRNANDIVMAQACHIIGLLVVSDATRTAGSATVRARVNGSGTTFNSGSVVLNATHTKSMSSIVDHASGLAVTAGQTVGVDVVTSGWTPITADLQAFIVLSMD